jgi:hypothetical protein
MVSFYGVNTLCVVFNSAPDMCRTGAVSAGRLNGNGNNRLQMGKSSQVWVMLAVICITFHADDLNQEVFLGLKVDAVAISFHKRSSSLPMCEGT